MDKRIFSCPTLGWLFLRRAMAMRVPPLVLTWMLVSVVMAVSQSGASAQTIDHARLFDGQAVVELELAGGDIRGVWITNRAAVAMRVTFDTAILGLVAVTIPPGTTRRLSVLVTAIRTVNLRSLGVRRN